MPPFALPRGKAVRFDGIDDDDGNETEKPRKESRWRFMRKESAEGEKKVAEGEAEVVWQIPAVAAVRGLEGRWERRKAAKVARKVALFLATDPDIRHRVALVRYVHRQPGINGFLVPKARKPKPQYHLPDADGNLPWVRPTSPVKLFRKKVPPLRAKYKPRTAITQVSPKAKWIKVNGPKVVEKKVLCDYIPWNKGQSVFLGPHIPSHYELRDGKNGEIEWIPPKPTRRPPPVPRTPRLVELVEEPLDVPPVPKKKKKARKDGEVREKKGKKHDRSQPKKNKEEKDGEVHEKKNRKHDRSRPKKEKDGEVREKKSRSHDGSQPKVKAEKDGEVREKKCKKHDRSQAKKNRAEKDGEKKNRKHDPSRPKKEKDGEVREKKSQKHDRSQPKKNKTDSMSLVKSKSKDFLIHQQNYDPFLTENLIFDIPMPVPMPQKKKEKKEKNDGVPCPKRRKNEKSPRLQELNEDGTPLERKTKTAGRPRKKKTKKTDCTGEDQIKSPDLAGLDCERNIKDCLPYRNTENQSLEKKPRTADTSYEHIDNVYPPRPMRTKPNETLREGKTKTADHSREKQTEDTNLDRKKKMEDAEIARKREAYAEVLRRGTYMTYAINPFRLSPKKPRKATIAHSETKQKDGIFPTTKVKDDATLRAMKSIRDLFSREKKDGQDDGARQRKLEKEVTSHTDRIDRHTSFRKKNKRNVRFGGNKKVKDAAYYAKKRANAVRLIGHIENKLANPVESAYPLDQAYAKMDASSRKTSPQVRNPFEQKRSAPVPETHNRRPSLGKETFSSPVLPTRQPTISARRGARPPARLGRRRPTLNSSVTGPAVPTATPTRDEPSSMQETLRRRPTLGDLLVSIYNRSTSDLCPPDETAPPVPRIPLSFTNVAIGMAAPSIVSNQVATPTTGSTPPMGNAFSGSGFWGRRSTPTAVNTPITPKKQDLITSAPRDSVNSKASSTLVPSVTSSSSPQKSEYTISGALTTLISADTVRGPSLIEPFPEFEPLLGDIVSIEECEAVRQILLERYAISQQPPKVQKVNPNAPAAWTRYGMVKGGPETPKRDTPNPPEKWTGLGYDKNNMPTPPPPKTPTRPGIGSSKFSKFSFLSMASKETLPMAESQISLVSLDSSTPSTANSSPRKVSALPNQVVGSKKKKKNNESDEDPEVTALRTALEVNTDYLDELYKEVAEHLGYKTWIEMLSQYPADFGKLLKEWDEEEEQIVIQFKMDDDVHLRHVSDWRFPVGPDDPNNYEFETVLDRQRRAYAELHLRRLCADHHQMAHELRVIWASEFWGRTQAKWIEARNRHESERKSQENQALDTVAELPEIASDKVSIKSNSSGKKDAPPEEESDKHSIKSNVSDKSDDTVTNFNHASMLQSIKAVSREASVDFPPSPPTPRAVSRQAIFDLSDSPPTPTIPKATLRPFSKATETEAESKRRHRCTAVAVGHLWSPPADDEPLAHGQSKRLASVAIDPESDWSREMDRVNKLEQQRQEEEAARRREYPTFTKHPALSGRDRALQALEGNDSANSYFTQKLPAVRQPPVNYSVATQRPPLPDRNPYRLMIGNGRPATAERQPRVETNPFFRGFVAPPEREAGERRQGSGGQRTHRRNRHPKADVGYFLGTRESEEMQ